MEGEGREGFGGQNQHGLNIIPSSPHPPPTHTNAQQTNLQHTHKLTAYKHTTNGTQTFAKQTRTNATIKQEGNQVALVQRYCGQGDLLKTLQRCGGRMGERAAVQAVVQPLLTVLLYLHARGVTHR